MPQDTPSARGRSTASGSGMVRASSLTREPQACSRYCKFLNVGD